MTSYERFKNLCEAHGLSARQAALKCDIDPSTIAHWKRGDYVPGYDKRKKLADFFGVNIEWLDDGKTEDAITKARLEMRDEEKTLASLARDANPEQIKLAITFLKTIMGE